MNPTTTTMIFGWPSIAKTLGLSVRRAREIVSARGLIAERRNDGAVGVPAQALRALAEELGDCRREDGAVIEGVAEPHPEHTPTLEGDLEPSAEVSPPALDARLANGGCDIDDEGERARDLSAELDRQYLLMEQLDVRIQGVAQHSSTVTARVNQTESLLWQQKQSAARDRQWLWALKAEVQQLRRQVEALEGALRAMPMALVSTGHKCGACGAKALMSPVGCGACGLGIGPGR
ncbi:MAG: hypothetical protein SF187_19895 [Deltaproteobacteria bacterium]|nr:hypothetical protein [Deltaproteobacteria bacterium]